MHLSHGLKQWSFNLLEKTQDGVLLLDMEGKILFSNEAFSKIFGHSKEKLQNKTCSVLASEPKIVIDEIIRSLTLNHSTVLNFKCKGADGEYLKVTASFSFLREDVVIHNGILVVVKNRSLESEEEKKFLSRQNNLLRSFNSRSDEICMLYDLKNYRNLFCSSTIEQILGWTSEEYYNGGWAFSLSITHPEDVDKVQQVFSKEISKRKYKASKLDDIAIVLEYRKQTKKGDYKWVRTESWVLDRDENGELFHVIVFSKDITLEKLNDQVIQNPNIIELLKNGINQINSQSNNKSIAGIPTHGLQLSGREREILALIKIGLSTKEIALKLSLTSNTVNSYRKNLMHKLSAKNSAELVNLAIEQNIV